MLSILWTLLLVTSSNQPVIKPLAPIPTWAQVRWQAINLDGAFSRAAYAQPGFLQADFNGDGQRDIAILITRKQNRSQGLVILHRGQTAYHVLGAGSPYITDMLYSSFGWVTYWKLYINTSTFEVLFDKSGEMNGERNVRLRHPAIEIGKEEVGGGMIYWNGKKYVWLHQSC
ncbi:hypothetical protein [Hymenobacter koreensis]|uniref:hypothetical protein n=1 Tax=Hymenobacter koreensis TaxID=1084523 RepID=UPI0031E9F517